MNSPKCKYNLYHYSKRDQKLQSYRSIHCKRKHIYIGPIKLIFTYPFCKNQILTNLSYNKFCLPFRFRFSFWRDLRYELGSWRKQIISSRKKKLWQGKTMVWQSVNPVHWFWFVSSHRLPRYSEVDSRLFWLKINTVIKCWPLQDQILPSNFSVIFFADIKKHINRNLCWQSVSWIVF